MIKAVIFDMDGLLIDTEKHLVECWVQAAQEAGYPAVREHGLMLRSLARRFAEPKLKELFGEDFDYVEVRERRKVLVEERLQKFGLEKKPYVDELLDYLKSHGIKTAVATATDEERAVRYLNQIGVADRFDRIVCTNMVKVGKPEPDVYLYACEQIGEKPENCMALEDSPNGTLSAYRAGCKVVMVPDLTEPTEEMKPRLTGVAENLKAVIPILEDLQKDI